MAELQYELRMYKGLISEYHDDAEAGPCPEVFRGKDDAWIACDHPEHALDEKGAPIDSQDRRRRLLREVIPRRAVEYKEAEQAMALKGGPAASAGAKTVRSRPARTKDGPRPCGCGCGGETKGGKFIPGHDAKLKSRLLKTVADVGARPDARVGAYSELLAQGWEGVVKPPILEELRSLGVLDEPQVDPSEPQVEVEEAAS